MLLNKAKMASQQEPIMSLQEFVKQPVAAAASTVPQCYVRDGLQEALVIVDDGAAPPLLPTIDMSRLTSSEYGEDELQKLHSSCLDWGFFQVVNHGVSSSLVTKVKHEVEEFYKLPLEERMKYQRRGNDVEGYGHTSAISEDEKLDWGDRLYMLVSPVHQRKPHLFPQFPPSLRDALESYLLELQTIAKALFHSMARALKMELEEMEETFEDGVQTLRQTYYPPCPQPELVRGLNSHTDGAGLTILLEVNGVEGLQIKKDGLWVPVRVPQDAFVVNVGDILEIFTNGIYKSVEHRVMTNSTKERISMAVFYSPNLEAEVGPARSLVTPQNPPLFTSVSLRQYIKNFFSRKLDRKTNLEHMRIKSDEKLGETD